MTNFVGYMMNKWISNKHIYNGILADGSPDHHSWALKNTLILIKILINLSIKIFKQQIRVKKNSVLKIDNSEKKKQTPGKQ